MSSITLGPALSLRERKKRRTRQAIIEAGVDLFAERGYVETTLADVAAAAEIGTSTFFNYFNSKADIVFGLIDAIIESARERIVDRPDEESATDAILGWVRTELMEIERPYSKVMRAIPSIIASDEELQAADRLRLAQLEDVFASAYARELGESTESVRTRVMAVITLRGMSEVWDLWYGHHVYDTEFEISEALELKAKYLEPALAAGLTFVASLPTPSGES